MLIDHATNTKHAACITAGFCVALTMHFGLYPAVAQESEPTLRAGAATSNITPWLGMSINCGMRERKAVHIHDELLARCLVLDNGRTRIAVVICDSCMIPRDVFDAAKRMVHEHTGVPVDHMLMAATHAHSAATAAGVFQSDPDELYLRFLTLRIADGVRRALNQLEPAEIGWGVGRVPQHVFNRRWKMKPGAIPPDPFGATTDRVRMNPPRGSDDLVEPAGPIDPELAVISVRARDGRPIALLANYSLHYVGGTGSGHISADYFGAFAEQIQKRLGADHTRPPFVGILSNGTSGDINNIDFRHQRERRSAYEQIQRVADDVATEAHRVYSQIKHRPWVPLGARQTTIELGVRRPSAQDVQRARAVLEGAEANDLRTRPEIYARETVLLSEYPPQVELVLQALRIGELGIAAIPCEVFVEIGLDIKRDSPLRPTFSIGLANGYNGYLPTPEQHALGGYETWRARSSYLETEASPRITRTILDLLAGLR